MPEPQTPAPAVKTPEVLQYVRESGPVDPGHFYTHVPEELKALFASANCRLSWQRNEAGKIAANAGHHHHPVTRAMIIEMVGEDRAAKLLASLPVDKVEGFIVKDDMLLCARHRDAHEAEQSVFMEQSMKRLGMQSEQDSLISDTLEIARRLRAEAAREGVSLKPPDEDEMRKFFQVPNAGDLVQVDKRPI